MHEERLPSYTQKSALSVCPITRTAGCPCSWEIRGRIERLESLGGQQILLCATKKPESAAGAAQSHGPLRYLALLPDGRFKMGWAVPMNSFRSFCLCRQVCRFRVSGRMLA